MLRDSTPPSVRPSVYPSVAHWSVAGNSQRYNKIFFLENGSKTEGITCQKHFSICLSQFQHKIFPYERLINRQSHDNEENRKKRQKQGQILGVKLFYQMTIQSQNLTLIY